MPKAELRFQWARLGDLSAPDFHAAMVQRVAVFVVEQNCVYQDIDSKDEKAIHILGKFEDKIVVYARIFNAGAYFENASIGRVVISEKYRTQKWGHELMKKAISSIESEIGVQPITISAQLYLKKFYENHGFVQLGEMYLEDGIPHIEMLRQ